MNYAVLAVLLLALGLALLVAEVFIPSGGMILIAALVCLGIALLCAYYAWWETDRFYWWSYLGLLIFLFPAVLGGAFYGLPRTSFGRNLLATPPTEEEIAPFAREQQRLRDLIGKRGKSLSLMTPGGLVLIDGERMHAETEGMLVEPNEEVKVVGVKGNRIVVRAISPGQEGGPAVTDDLETAGLDAPSGQEPRPLDFDVPQS